MHGQLTDAHTHCNKPWSRRAWEERGVARGQLTLTHTLCNKPSNRADTHMKESFCWCHTPRKRQDLYRCRSCVQHALGPAAGPTPYNGNTYTHFPLQLRMLSQRPHTAAQHPLLFVPRRRAPRRPGGWGSPPWRCRKQLSPPGLSRPAHAHHHTSPPACCCGAGRGGSCRRGIGRRRRG